jgi:hypothetical protein
MKLTLRVDELDRLICTLEDDGSSIVVTASNHDALPGLISAVDDAEKVGMGECFWQEARGEYRWMLRRDGDNLRIAVLWSTGTLTGWEHLLWSECKLADFRDRIKTEASRLTMAAAGC